MVDDDKKEFAQFMAGMFAVYNKEVSQMLLRIWFESLRQYDLKAVKDALARHLLNPDNGQFLPKPADVVKLIGGTTIDTALEAWSAVDNAVRTVGTYRSVAFADPIIHKVIQDMGGWVALGNKKEDEWPFVAKEFQTRYRGIKTTGQPVDALPQLTGIAAQQNSVAGIQYAEPPILIGKRNDSIRTLDSTHEVARLSGS
tara:strand:- start:133 stop:729 length:597 start_codon:yes stop_codon:yes gene_type:complete